MVKKKRVPIIFEDDAIIVCEKPAGMPVQSDHTRDLDVHTTLKHHIFEEQAGEEEPYKVLLRLPVLQKYGVLMWYGHPDLLYDRSVPAYRQVSHIR